MLIDARRLNSKKTETLECEDIDNSVYRCKAAFPVEFELSCMIHTDKKHTDGQTTNTDSYEQNTTIIIVTMLFLFKKSTV